MPADTEAPIYLRVRSMSPEEKLGEEGRISLVASTDEAVDWGGWREVLSHEEGAVDMDGARSLLVNHRADMLAGGISAMRVADGRMTSDAEIDDDVRMQSGISVRKAVKKGYLRGVSIGYTYESKDTVYDEATRTLTVKRWRLLEISLTPIPADKNGQVRSLPDGVPKAHPAATPATTPNQRTIMPDPIQNPPPANDEAARAREIAALRERAENAERKAEQSSREAKLRALASEHHIPVDGIDFAAFKDEAEGQRALLKKLAERNATPPPADPVVTVTRDAADKLLARAKGGLLALARLKPEKHEEAEIAAVGGVRAISIKALIRQAARADGHFDADSWSDMDLAMFATRHINLSSHGRRDASAANKVVAGFSNILANVAWKAIQGGLSAYNAATWQLWCTERNVPNFLQVTNAALSSGRLTETAEDVAFPELTQKDGGYNSTLGLFGATVSLTYQTIVNDSLGQFMDSLRRIGAIAAQTVDKLAYTKLLGATWTNDVSASAGLATLANLDKPRAALRNKLSPAGEKMGIMARFLLHDPANALAAQQATGAIYAGGATTAPSLGARQITPVESQWIGDTGILGGALTTDYYLAGDPNIVDTVLVNFLDGVGFSPIIMPFDPGAVAAEKYKIMLPVQATIATHVDSAAATRISGLQKATVA